MLTIQGKSSLLCDGLRRRDFLQVGGIGSLGLGLPQLLRAAPNEASNDPFFGRAKRCVLLFLMGGPPQLDTWDLKPHAPAEIRGELRPISTVVPGIQISELFPALARQADKYLIVRSVTHTDNTHTTAGYTMLTGADHPTPGSLDGPRPNDQPHFGCLLGLTRDREGELPAFVALPEIVKDAAVNEVPGQGGGFLGKRFDPFLIQANSAGNGFRVPPLLLPEDISARRFRDRKLLLDQLDQLRSSVERSSALEGLDDSYRQAFETINSDQARRAFRLDEEPASVVAAYGEHLFGQGCLLARRLLEAGVSLVSVYWHYEGPDDSPVWDTHGNNFPHLRQRLMPPTDRAVSTLLKELSERGLLEDTLLICMGEFGRSPKINGQAGRDHWPQVQSIMLAGAGLRAGAVHGSTDPTGGYPHDAPVTPADLTGTFLHLLGIPAELELRDRLNRPIPASRGEPVRAFFA